MARRAVCPVAGATRLWLLSPRKAIDSLIAGLELDAAALGNQRVLNLPGISVSVDEMVAALREVAGDEVAKRIVWAAGCARGEDRRQLAGAVGYVACATAGLERRAEFRRCDPQLYRGRADSRSGETLCRTRVIGRRSRRSCMHPHDAGFFRHVTGHAGPARIPWCGLGSRLTRFRATRLLSSLIVRYMTVCSHKEQMAVISSPSFTILR